MVVALVAFVFALFITIDVILRWRSDKALQTVGETLHEALDEAEPRWVGGFRLPALLHYHQGHTWVHCVGSDQAYVGVDDFARRLLGRNVRFRAPSVGDGVRQGDGAFTVRLNGDELQLLSPVGGEVVAVNPALKRDPHVVHDDAYGKGWIYKVRSPRLFKELSNLLQGSLAVKWMEDTRDRFQHRMMLESGSVIQDGGNPVEDIAANSGREQWLALVQEFLLQKRAP